MVRFTGFCLRSLLGIYFLIFLNFYENGVVVLPMYLDLIVLAVMKVRGVSAFGLVDQLNGTYRPVKYSLSASNSLQ